MPLKTVALVAALCMTTGWVLASLLAPPRAALQMLPERRSPARAAADTPVPTVERLELRLRHQPPPPTPRRNPFVFGATPVPTGDRTAPAGEVATIDEALTTNAPPPPVGPILTLVGMAVNAGAEGPVRTAVVSDARTVHLVKIGDHVAGYTVVAIDEASVTLSDGSGQRHLLRLTP